jgi:hypothetical protein
MNVIDPETKSLFSDSEQTEAMQLGAKDKYTRNKLRGVNSRAKYASCDRRLSSKSVPTFADRASFVVSSADPNGRIFGFLDRSR